MSNKQMVAIVTIGLPASGKSTWAKKVVENYKINEVNADDIRIDMMGLVDIDVNGQKRQTISQDRQGEVWDRHDQMIRALAARGDNVVISNTNTNSKLRRKLSRFLRELGYTIYYAFFNVHEDECLYRQQNRMIYIPDEVYDRMANALRASMPVAEECDGIFVIEQDGCQRIQPNITFDNQVDRLSVYSMLI